MGTCEQCGCSCEGQFCLNDSCVAERFGIKHPTTKPRRSRVKRLPQHIRPAKMKRKSRVEMAPRTNDRETEQHTREEDGQRVTCFRYLDRHGDHGRAGVEELLAFKEQL